MSKKWYNLFVSVDQPEEDEVPASELPSGNVPGAGQPQQPARRPSAPSAAQTVAEIAAAAGAEPKFSAAAGTPVSFDEIYRLAEIRTPEHGYTIWKIADMLQSEHLRGLAPSVKRASVLAALEAAGVKIDEVIQDAVRRDRALDAYERAQQKALEDLETAKTKQNRDVQAEMDRMIAEHQARMKANSDQIAAEKERFYGWQLKKQQEEQKIADAVGYFLTENPITTSRTPAGPAVPKPQPPAPKTKEP